MISSPFILNLNFTHLSTVLLNQSLLQPIYLHSITVSVNSQGHTDLIYFHQGQAFDKVRHTFFATYTQQF
jgi:hypothetical protein